jgi:hypothetical protein
VAITIHTVTHGTGLVIELLASGQHRRVGPECVGRGLPVIRPGGREVQVLELLLTLTCLMFLLLDVGKRQGGQQQAQPAKE